MRDMSRRLKNIEKQLCISEKPKTVTIVHFSDELPSDYTNGNTTIHFVKYDWKPKHEQTIEAN